MPQATSERRRASKVDKPVLVQICTKGDSRGCYTLFAFVRKGGAFTSLHLAVLLSTKAPPVAKRQAPGWSGLHYTSEDARGYISRIYISSIYISRVYISYFTPEIMYSTESAWK